MRNAVTIKLTGINADDRLPFIPICGLQFGNVLKLGIPVRMTIELFLLTRFPLA
jgi:hypothetical protein